MVPLPVNLASKHSGSAYDVTRLATVSYAVAEDVFVFDW